MGRCFGVPCGLTLQPDIPINSGISSFRMILKGIVQDLKKVINQRLGALVIDAVLELGCGCVRALDMIDHPCQ